MGLENSRQIKIGDKLSYSDFGLFLSSGWTLSESAPKTTYVDVPEADGQLDMSEALSGEIHYQSRNFSASLIFQDDTQANWELKRRQLANYAHGRRLKLQLPDTPDYYLQGRFSVGPLKTDYPFATVDVTAILEPWLYKNDLTVYSRPAPLPPVQNADGSYNHVAYAYSADGTDRFSTTYPNLNLLDGTKDFSGTWENSSFWENDGTYKGLTVKKRTAQWQGLYKIFTANKDGVFTFSAYIKASGTTTTINRYKIVNGVSEANPLIDSNFDWRIDTETVSLKAGQTALFRYEISSNNADAILWNAGQKWEEGSNSTPYMPSASEVTTSDYPSYIGQYIDSNTTASTDPTKYLWQPYFLPVGGSIALVLSNERKTAVPTLTTNQPLSITRGSLTENIGVGTFQLPDFALAQGDTNLTITNKGTTVAEFSISYQEGSQ